MELINYLIPFTERSILVLSSISIFIELYLLRDIKRFKDLKDLVADEQLLENDS